MTIKTPEKQDIPALRALWKEAFGDPDTFLDTFFVAGFSPNRSRGVFLENQPVAALYWFDCAWAGKKIAYLYAIATAKNRQGQGLCRALMTDTHNHLKSLGYHGAALVPAKEELFSLYEKFGYEGFYPATRQEVTAEEKPISLQPIDGQTYSRLRQNLLPQDALLQEGATVAFLSGFAEFYQLDSGIACAAKEGDTLYIQEYLADPKELPAFAFALGCQTAQARLAGGKNCAMYLPFDGEKKRPAYLGIHLD